MQIRPDQLGATSGSGVLRIGNKGAGRTLNALQRFTSSGVEKVSRRKLFGKP